MNPSPVPRETKYVISEDFEEQVQLLTKENNDLKAYVKNLNSECMELNAVLFEEANKMVMAVRMEQHKTEKYAKEKSQENESLRSQLDVLRSIISDLPSPLPVRTDSTSNPVSKNRFRRLRRQDRINSTPTLFQKSGKDLSLLVSSSGGGLSTVSRCALLDALLADISDSTDFDSPIFQLFKEWVGSDCPIPLNDRIVHNSFSAFNEKGEIIIIRENRFQNSDDSDLDSPSSLSTQNYVRNESRFVQALYKIDVDPCLQFHDTALVNAIYHALPTLALEMVPLGMSLDVDSDVPKYCPLLPSLKVAYLLTLNVEPKDLKVYISTEARNRIAAVFSLFQYLSFIRRGVTSSTSSSAGDKFDQISHHLQHGGHTNMRKDFLKIRRCCLTIAFARLGFGLPEID